MRLFLPGHLPANPSTQLLSDSLLHTTRSVSRFQRFPDRPPASQPKHPASVRQSSPHNPFSLKVPEVSCQATCLPTQAPSFCQTVFSTQPVQSQVSRGFLPFLIPSGQGTVSFPADNSTRVRPMISLHPVHTFTVGSYMKIFSNHPA